MSPDATVTTTAGPPAGTTTTTTTKTPPPSTPAPTCTVPATKGLTVAKAKAKLRAAHCKAGSTVKAHSKTVRNGRVIGTSPKAGSKILRTTAVSVRVSTGPKRTS